MNTAGILYFLPLSFLFNVSSHVSVRAGHSAPKRTELYANPVSERFREFHFFFTEDPSNSCLFSPAS